MTLKIGQRIKKTMKLVYGGLSNHFLIADVRLSVTSAKALSPLVEIMVFEEDTNLILTVDREIQWHEEHPIRQMTAILRAKKHSPGSLVRNGKSWYAVVIDLDQDIVCRVDWIAEAYRRLFTALNKERITAVALHLLGDTHGKIGEKAAVKLLVEGLQVEAPKGLKYIEIFARQGRAEAVRREFRIHAQQEVGK
jgi:hypothetical protein